MEGGRGGKVASAGEEIVARTGGEDGGEDRGCLRRRLVVDY